MKSIVKRWQAVPRPQRFRFSLIVLSCLLFLAPLVVLPSLFGNSDFCGRLCMRRFYLFFPGMGPADIAEQMRLASVGVALLGGILVSTFFFGRLWCAYMCPMGGFPELVSRSLDERWKIEYRSLPQVPIRYGYFAVYLLLMPALGVSACSLCNFITVPRFFEALAGGAAGLAFLLSGIGLVNLALLVLLGFFASRGRAYCQFLCPIGAIDALVNRAGAALRFTRRIRVERERCSGCNKCARACMTGAIRMVDRIAEVDQLACMSCHECVDVCEFGAIEWLSLPPEAQPKRKKKGLVVHPQPVWTAIAAPKPPRRRRIDWRRTSAATAIGALLLFVWVAQAGAAPRHGDPDGCLVCHGIAGLDYVDADGLVRSASIDTQHYLGSLHGSVPCTDCHRDIERYPHDPEHGAVDCAATCHLEEPSRGEAYSHQALTEEYRASAHGEGGSDGFRGGNRLAEARAREAPSCRWCHRNTPYVSADKLALFRDTFAHTDTACGSCHQGESWRRQYGGHILRRLLGARWDKREQNALCADCHADRPRMRAAEPRDPLSGERAPADARFVLAADTYAMTLHGRLVGANVDQGAACIDCHAPGGHRHGVESARAPDSPTHPDNRAATCARAGCHGYAEHPLNAAFVATDLHHPDLLPDGARQRPWQSNWYRAALLLAPLAVILGVGGGCRSLFGERRGNIFAVLGGGRFQRLMLGTQYRQPKTGSKRPPRASPRRKGPDDETEPKAGDGLDRPETP